MGTVTTVSKRNVYAAPLGPDLALIVEESTTTVKPDSASGGLFHTTRSYEAFTIDGDANFVFTVAVTTIHPDGNMIALWSEDATIRMRVWQDATTDDLDHQWVGWPTMHESASEAIDMIDDSTIRLWGTQVTPESTEPTS